MELSQTFLPFQTVFYYNSQPIWTNGEEWNTVMSTEQVMQWYNKKKELVTHYYHNENMV